MIDWPEPARPGVPLNPEQDGWHFLRMNNGTLKATLWRADGYWLNPPGYDGLTSPKTTAYWNTYLGPILTPDEVAALQARVAELEGALKDAVASVKEWGAYASQYFQDKWDLPGEVARYIAIAEGKNDVALTGGKDE